MTRIRIDLRAPVSGGSNPVKGLVLFRPTARVVSDGAVVLPKPFAVRLEGVHARGPDPFGRGLVLEGARTRSWPCITA